MRTLIALAFMAFGTGLMAEGERPGDFDYYVLALSWSPTWCALEGDARGSDQCDDRHDYGWTLHGLWPQYDTGWPSYCPTTEAGPTSRQADAMVDIMGSAGLARHQWRKHGTCDGDPASAYFGKARTAYDQITRPEVFRKLPRAVKLPADVVEEAFLKDNPDLKPDMLVVTCRSGRIQEVRVCLDKSLAPRGCTGSVARACTLDDALFDPVR